MKIEVNISKKYFFGILLIGLMVVGFVGVYAYNNAGTGGVPSKMGHSVDEMDWSKKVNGSVTADGFCIGSSCVTVWPSGGGGSANLIAGNGIILTAEAGGTRINSTATGGGSASIDTSTVLLPGGYTLQQYLNNLSYYFFPQWDYINSGYAYEAGDVVLASFGSDGRRPADSPIKIKEAVLGAGGTVKASIRIYTLGNQVGYALIYKNGHLVTELGHAGNDAKSFSKDISGWEAGDKLQLYIKSSRGSYDQNVQTSGFKISVREIPNIPPAHALPTPTVTKTLD
jgi:hypothetical protein